MEFVVPTQEELGFGLRALKAVALVDGALHSGEREVIAAAQTMFGDARDIDSLAPITPEELAEGISSPATRRQLLGGMIVVCMADGEVNEEEAALIAAFARALGIEDSALANLRRIAKRQNLRARLDIIRRHWALRKIKEMAEQQGIGVYARAILGMLRIREDREMVARYRAFEAYPPGSLGRAYFDYMVGDGFSFPGERGAPPEAMVFHDMTHILSGYATTPEGEICAATFSAGYSTREVYNWFMFVLSQFQLGLPTAPGVPPERMKLDPMKMLIAYRRGAAMTIDINEGWDFWEVIDQPVEALRERYHILPESHFAHLLGEGADQG